MKYLLASLLLVPITTQAALTDYPQSIDALKTAAETVDVPYRLLAAICFIESSLRPYVAHPNDGGATSHGLCQIKTATAKDVGFSGNTSQLYNPYVNALYAAKYLKKQLDRYDNDWIMSIAAYNRGHTGDHIINQEYVAKVLKIAITL